MENDNLPIHKTQSPALATFLIVNGHQVVIDDPGFGRATFVFKNVPRQLIIDYSNMQARVEPSTFALRMSELVQSVKRVRELK